MRGIRVLLLAVLLIAAGLGLRGLRREDLAAMWRLGWLPSAMSVAHGAEDTNVQPRQSFSANDATLRPESLYGRGLAWPFRSRPDWPPRFDDRMDVSDQVQGSGISSTGEVHVTNPSPGGQVGRGFRADGTVAGGMAAGAVASKPEPPEVIFEEPEEPPITADILYPATARPDSSWQPPVSQSMPGSTPGQSAAPSLTQSATSQPWPGGNAGPSSEVGPPLTANLPAPASPAVTTRSTGPIPTDMEPSVRPAVEAATLAATSPPVSAEGPEAAVFPAAEPAVLAARASNAQPFGDAGGASSGDRFALSTESPPLAYVPYERATLLARVGSDVILAGELLGAANEILGEMKDRIPPGEEERYKQMIIKQLLRRRLEAKLIYQDAARTIPRESLDRFREELSKEFEEREVPRRLKSLGLNSRQQLEQQLQSLGSSLEQEKNAFIESVIARQWLQQRKEEKPQAVTAVDPEELLEYYRSHLPEFERPGWALWEQLMIRKRPDRPDAVSRNLLASLGNRVLAGEPFADVARSGSEGPTAAQGGVRERTVQGSLRSQVLDEAIFRLPVGQLSPILEDESGFHIVRVVQREDARRIPFEEAQSEIRERLRKQREQKKIVEYLDKLRREIPVWTVYDSAKPVTVGGVKP